MNDDTLSGALPNLTEEELQILREQQVDLGPNLTGGSEEEEPIKDERPGAQPEVPQQQNNTGWDEAAYQRGELNDGPYWNRIDDKGVLRPVTTSPFLKEDGTFDFDKAERYGREKDFDLLAGLWDFAAPIVNLIPGVTAKPVPKFENEMAQAVREISSVVVPTMALGAMGTTRLGSAAAQVPNARVAKLLTDPLARKLGNATFNAGAGAFVDYVVPMNQTDDNLTGSLKKMWPRSLGWIPENIATLDGDSPETKRWKNVLEGTYLGLATDLLTGFSRLTAEVGQTHDTLKFIPENETGAAWLKKNQVIDDLPEDVAERAAAKRSEALDELGSYNADKATNPNESIFGYHDVFGTEASGIRSVDDFGIIGASVDVVRINNNLGTSYGRVGSVMSEGALKFANDTGQGELIIRGLAETLKDAGEYGYKVSDSRYITHAEIMESGEKLANDFYEMDLAELQRTITPGSIYQPGRDADSGVAEMTSEAYAGVMGAIKKYMDDFINMDEAKARAYVSTSLAGQVSDTAMGMRLTDGSGSMARAQEQILDRVEFLMAQKAQTSYIRGRALNQLNLWNRMTRMGSEAYDAAYAKRMENLVKNEKNNTLKTVERIKQESKETVNNLRSISKENPEMLAPLMMAYELTDGNVKSITALNNYVKQSTSVWKKAFIDLQPNIPSVINRAFYANVYNSALSAFATTGKAVISGSHLMVEKPLRHFAGALRNRDLQTARRGLYQYSNTLDTVRRGLGYMRQIWKKSAIDPGVLTPRENIVLKNTKQLEVLQAFADAKAAKEEFGPQYLIETIKAMNDLADHPVMRFGTRSMQAMDGFVQSMIADFEAKGRAFDQITAGGTKAFDDKAAEAVYKEAHAKMFNENGIITDEAVQRAAGEISLNLDNPANDALSGMIARMPILKPFLLFTKTPLNELALTASYNPLGFFVKDINQFQLRFEEMPMERSKELLTARGIEVTDLTAKAKYNEIRADLMGRKAVGTLATGLAVGLFMDDRLHGSGHYDRQVQKTRNESGWKRNSIRGFDDKWYSYEGLGPITNYIQFVANVMDNFDTLEPNSIGRLLKQSSFLLSASITDKTYMAGMEPFFDVLSGNGGAINRWSSSFLSAATVPGSSQMAEIARLLDPGLKVINNELDGMILNRLPGLKSTLPAQYDWIDGTEVNVVPVNSPESFFARLRNTYTPWKESGKISPEKQFLIDIEYDATATLGTNGKGEPLSNAEQSEILSILGKTGYWRQKIKEIMDKTEGGGKGFRKRVKDAQSGNYVDKDGKPGKPLPATAANFEMVHRQLDDALRDAIDDAMGRSPRNDGVMQRQHINDRVKDYLQRGQTGKANEFLDFVENSN